MFRTQIICPAPVNSLYGIRVTAVRWARILRALGHNAEVSQHYGGTICDLMIAMQAHRSAPAVLEFRERHPDKPVVVVLTGTDLYRDLSNSEGGQRALEIADRLVILQPLAAKELPKKLHGKLRLIYQSAERTPSPVPSERNAFVVSVVGHLRKEKDPLRAVIATRRLPKSSRIRVVQAGEAMDGELVEQARAEVVRNPRYRFLGGIPRWKVRRLIAGSRLLVVSSQYEGGANVISEAVVDYVPVLASRIPGNVGLLGEDYPGYFPVGSTKTLTELLRRAEADVDFYQELKSRCVLSAPLFRPERERASWRKLLKEMESRGS